MLCLGCAAQAPTPELTQRIERAVRAQFSIPPGVEVGIGERKPSPDFPSYDAVNVTFSQGERKQNHEFLVSKDGKSLVRVTRMDISKDPYAEVMSKIDLTGRPMKGSKDAKVTIVNYDDFQCPFCSRMHTTLMEEVLKEYGDKVRVYYKDYPLTEIHPWAVHAAVNANCLAKEHNDAYWAYADHLHATQRTISSAKGPIEQKAFLDKAALEQAQKFNLPAASVQSCIKKQDDSAVTASMKEATALGVQATPTLFINGEKVDGALPGEQLRLIIDRALKDAGQPAAAAANN